MAGFYIGDARHLGDGNPVRFLCFLYDMLTLATLYLLPARVLIANELVARLRL